MGIAFVAEIVYTLYMQSFSSLVSQSITLPATKTRSERGYVIGLITEKLKLERLAHPFYYKDKKKINLKPISERMVAIRVSHLKNVDDLYYLYSICKQSKTFSQGFFYWTKQTILPTPEQNSNNSTVQS